MDMEKLRMAALAALLGTTAALLPAHSAELTEARIFEWWDDGTIEAEEANEMLGLIDEGNMQEACALAEIHANEPCETEPADEAPANIKPASKKRQPQAKTARGKKPQKKYGGFLSTRMRLDSAGSVSAHREELRLDFYRLSLRLGSQELLTYRGKRGEAHLGQVSTREMHSAIPLDTLWGTALTYSLGKFSATALLDTSGTASAQFKASAPFKRGPFAGMAARVAYWHADTSHSASIALTFPAGQVAYWQQFGESAPLIHFRLHGRDSSTLSWRTTGYIHGEALPQPARLSASILKNRFWTTQNISYRAGGLLDTRISASARILSPLHSDSISGRLALDIESGPPSIRGSARITCREASEDCRQTIYQGEAASSHGFGHLTATLSCGARTEHHRTDESWKRPRLEIGTAVSESLPGKRENLFRLSLVAPDSHPLENTQVRSETRLSGDFLEFTLIATFKKTGGGEIRPTHAQISSKILF